MHCIAIITFENIKTPKHSNILSRWQILFTVFCIFKVNPISLEIKWQILSITSILKLYGMFYFWYIPEIIARIFNQQRGTGCQRFRYAKEGGCILLKLWTITSVEGGPNVCQKLRYVTFEWSLSCGFGHIYWSNP